MNPAFDVTHVFRRLLASLVLVQLVACGGGGAPEPPPPRVTGPVTVKAVLDQAVSQGVDGIWVYVDDGSGQTVTETAGFANRDTLRPARATDQFKIASISKLFIAVGVTKLVAQNLLTLDDSLSFWLPALASRIENADQITLRQLLQHRSGVPDFDSQPGFSWQSAHTSNEALLDLVLDTPADFAPDARYEYSNTNYLLLGMILDAALGYDHQDFVQSSTLTPLGLIGTYSLQSDTDDALLAHGYWGGIDRIDQVFVAPGGSMVSVVSETGVFLRELATGTALTDHERTIYEGVFDEYAHSGWLPGYQSIARYHPFTDTVIVQFVNTTGDGSEDIAASTYSRVTDLVRND